MLTFGLHRGPPALTVARAPLQAIAFAKLDAAAHPSIAVSLGVKSDVPKPAYVLIHKGKLKRVPLDSSGDAASLVRASCVPACSTASPTRCCPPPRCPRGSFQAALIEENTGIEARTSEVVSLTPSNFDQVAFNPKLSVMVEFYAPWCAPPPTSSPSLPRPVSSAPRSLARCFHCKSLVPAYEELSRVFSRDRSVVIAKVDAAQHRSLAERNNVKGFPTLLWFPASPRRQRAVYEGGRTVEAMVRFVNQHAGTHRAVDGGVSDAAGRVPAFDAHVQECVVPGVKAGRAARRLPSSHPHHTQPAFSRSPPRRLASSASRSSKLSRNWPKRSAQAAVRCLRSRTCALLPACTET